MMKPGRPRPCHVIPAQAGIHGRGQPFTAMDPGLRRGDQEKVASVVATTAIPKPAILKPVILKPVIPKPVIPAQAGIHRAAKPAPQGPH
jgi:hypothetical protein